MNWINKAGIFLWLLFWNTTADAQRKDFAVAIPSPNAASLGLYGEMPVSHFTGVPAISIPLYTVRGKSISLDLSLSYHAGGLRPDLHPGWAGNGWSLNAGGVITRKVNAAIDEFHKPYSGKHGYFYNYSNLNAGNWSSTTRLSAPVPAYSNVDGIPQPQLVDSDTEPDEFSFNFLNYSGKFYLDQTGVWQVQCDKALKVIFNTSDWVEPFVKNIPGLNISSNINKTFGKFTILDEKGNKYIFGSTDANNTAIEFSDVMIPNLVDGRGGSITATSWYLTKIISADENEFIDLVYERGPITSQIGFGAASTAIDASGGGFTSMDPPCSYAQNGRFGLNGTVLFPVYLTSISMPAKNLLIDFTEKSKSDELVYKWNGTNLDAYGKVWTDANAIPPTGTPADFPTFYADITSSTYIPYYATHTVPANRWERFIWLKLDAIHIKNTSTNTQIKQFDFWYNNNVNKRLQLDVLRLKDGNGTIIGSYTLGYNSTSLPDYITHYTDHWGFNNYTGSGGGNNLLPGAGGTTSTNYLALREPDATGVKTQAEILTSITYPTGGVTSFTYEPNKFSQIVERSTGNGVDPVSQAGTAGGLRIRQVSTIDNQGNTTTRQYYYVTNYTAGANPALLTSSGILDSKPQYTFNCTGVDNSGYTIYYQSISTHPIVPLTTNSSGTHIGYSEVVEYRSDGSYSLFKFSNHDNTLYRDQACLNSYNKWALGYSPIISNAYKRGKQLLRSDKDNNGNTVAEESMSYTVAGPSTTVNSVYSFSFNTCPNVGSYRGVLVRVAYQFPILSFFPSTIVSTSYPLGVSGQPFVKTTTISYDQYRNANQQQSTDSKGSTNTVTNRYPMYFAAGQVDNPYQKMIEMNNVSTVIERSVTRDATLLSREVNTFKMYAPSKIFQDAYYRYESATAELAAGVASSTYSYGGNLLMDSRVKLKSKMYYDPASNLSTVELKDDIPVAYIWNYGSQLPVAKISNAKNIYESGTSGNIQTQPDFTATLKGTPPFAWEASTFTVGRTGNVVVNFAYANPGIPGTNYTNVTVQLQGLTNSYSAYTTLCATTTYYSGCTNNTYTFTSVPSGTYNINTFIFSVTGFSNYYNYKLNVSYPSYQYAVIAESKNTAYTSFETIDQGGWQNVSAGGFVSSTASPTGNRYYTLQSQTPQLNNLSSGEKYIVSYWSNGSSYSVSGTQSVKTGKNYNGWTYYEHLVSGVSSVSVAGSGGIDELRLYPTGAQMTTYTYDPLIGITSECDINNSIIYYEYDAYGRLQVVRDQDRNILRKICYGYLGQPVNCN